MTAPPDFVNAPPGQNAGYFQALFAGRWGSQAGVAYITYNASNPGRTPYENAQAFAEIIALQGLQKGLAEAGSGVGSAQNAAITGAVKGAEQVVSWQTGLEAIGKFFEGLGKGSTWIRVAEGVLGLVLVLVAVGELGKGTAVGKAVKKIPFI